MHKKEIKCVKFNSFQIFSNFIKYLCMYEKKLTSHVLKMMNNLSTDKYIKDGFLYYWRRSTNTHLCYSCSSSCLKNYSNSLYRYV